MSTMPFLSTEVNNYNTLYILRHRHMHMYMHMYMHRHRHMPMQLYIVYVL